MINSKRGLIKRLQEDKTSLGFKTIYNFFDNNGNRNIRETREVERVQSNAFTLLSNRDNNVIESWIYPFNKDLEVKNNHIYYYGYFYDMEKAEKFIKDNNIPKEYSTIWTCGLDSINNGRINKYWFKVITIDIEIIEK